MNNSVRRLDVYPDVIVEVDRTTAAKLSFDALDRVNEIWRAATSKQDSQLFNGTVFSVQSVEPKRIVVTPVEYKQYYAQVCDPSHTNAFDIRPLACSGLLTCEDGLILGKRSPKVTLDPGKWELAPAGTFDSDCVLGETLDANILLLKEMAEEIGIPPRIAKTGKVVAVLEDEKTRCVDLLVGAHAAITRAEVDSYFEKRPQPEYTQIKVIACSSLSSFVEANKPRLSPVSLAALTMLDIHSACSLSG